MTETGQIIGQEYSTLSKETFHSCHAAGGENKDFLFYSATTEEVNKAAEKVASAFQVYRKKSGVEKATFLEAIAEEIMNAGDELITTSMAETALPQARLQGERGRTTGQLKMFADLLREGSWVDARIETAQPDRTPLPKLDIRFMHLPLGPVVVFGASNFPLAFSVAGGDTASALAAGCSVIVKAHPAHPATSAIVGKAIQKAAERTGMPDGVFSLLFDKGIEVGMQLVKHPLVKAVGFTGSFKGGKAIYDAAVSRPEPIPVYAEMGSSNPVFILPQAMKEKGTAIAEGYATSVTLGVGQFCTNPGLLIHQQNEDFTSLVKTGFEKTAGGVMLTPNIHTAYKNGVEKHLATEGVQQLAAGTAVDDQRATPVLMSATAESFSKNHQLSEEIFGPASLLISADSKEEMLKIANGLSGHLTATVHGTAAELEEYAELLDVLEQKVGRLLINGFPTGVEVCAAMVHGGPFPATTDSRSTSVGTAAIYRFTRPVSYQSMPQSLLPTALQDANPLKIWRLVNGKHTNEPIITA
jgi:NADP-dependent aldehyde dehydrogenase